METRKHGSPSTGPEREECLALDTSGAFPRFGHGAVGGKAQGLLKMQAILDSHFGQGSSAACTVEIPPLFIITTDPFDLFMERNRLQDLAFSDALDCHVANAFQKATLPESLVQVLRDLIAHERAPLAVRSSSLLEDDLQEPFAGVYATKMVPNNQFSADARLRTLVEAIKFVYASTFFRDAQSYRKALGRSDDEEKMAVIIQKVVGRRHGDRFYPAISGVGRSHNFYSVGHASPEEGVVSLALGLGKTIVDGGLAWTYCPAHPRAKPPFASTKEYLSQTQTTFWAVNMGKPPSYDPIQETEYLNEANLQDAESDEVLPTLASTYNPQSDRITPGTGSPGPRVLDFSPILELGVIPLNDLLAQLLDACEEAFENAVEIEFAVDIDPARGSSARLGFLQVRPMLVSEADVEVEESALQGDRVVVASEQVLGNGKLDCIRDIVYVKPDVFSAKDTSLIAAELSAVNRGLLESTRPYLLVSIGRLGTSDPWLGIPVRWGQISGAKTIVEVATADMNVDMSQGSHFFHNVTNLRVLYFSAGRTSRYPIRWDWLDTREVVRDERFVRHVTLAEPLQIEVDGRQGRGVITHGTADQISD